MTRTTKLCVTAFLAVVGTTVGITVATASDHHRGRGEREEEEHEGRGRSADGERGDGRAEPARGTAAPAASADPGAAALYRKECGACHLAFPPGLLPAESHRLTLAGLERHFGQNAELDAPVRARLERWMVDHSADAGADRKSGKVLASLDGAAPLRITEVPYFRRKHRKIGPDVVARPAVRSLAACAACHPGAQDWDFDDDRVKIPR